MPANLLTRSSPRSAEKSKNLKQIKPAEESPALSWMRMALPIKTCVICSEEFELRPDKPGFANRCPACSAPESAEPTAKQRRDAAARKAESELNEERRRTIRDMLYRKES
jgi:hypothetical protein